ncbi:signal recognition particle subunit srp68 [Chamberlinius hualienensis]
MAGGDKENVPVDENSTQKASANKKLASGSFTLEILLIIREAQQQHGLRHGDFQRYRSYCSRRLRRLRKSLHFTQGSKHRFQLKPVTAEHLSDARFLYLPLVAAERCWSYAMQLKQEANTEPRKRFHSINRLKKAVRVATDLQKLCESPLCDARTKLEAKAYCAWITGTLHFELKDWSVAMDHFRKAQTIYEKMVGAVTGDVKSVYQQRVDEINPNVRYCAYNIGDKSAMQDLMKMRRAVGQDLLAENLDSLITQTREKQASTLSEISWRGKVIPVKHEKVRLFLLNVQESEKEVQLSTESPTTRISVYERLLMECKDAIQVLKDELQTDYGGRNRQAPASESQLASLKHLHSYLVYIRLTKTVERNLLMIENMRKGDDGKKPKQQDFIRMYETIIQCLTEIEQIPEVTDDEQFARNIASQVLAYKAFRLYFMAQTFVASKRWVEGIALYERAERRGTDSLALNSLTDKLKADLQKLIEKMKGEKLSAHAYSILGQEDDKPDINNPIYKKALVERLDAYYEDPLLLTKQPNIIQFPPEMEPIPCKPLFFDIALNYVQFPSLDDRIEQKKTGGLTGMVKNWLWGGAKK